MPQQQAMPATPDTQAAQTTAATVRTAGMLATAGMPVMGITPGSSGACFGGC